MILRYIPSEEPSPSTKENLRHQTSSLGFIVPVPKSETFGLEFIVPVLEPVPKALITRYQKIFSSSACPTICTVKYIVDLFVSSLLLDVQIMPLL